MTTALPGYFDRRNLPPEALVTVYEQPPPKQFSHALSQAYEECVLCTEHWVYIADNSAMRHELGAAAVEHVPLRFTLTTGALGHYCVARKGDTGPITVRWVNLNARYLLDNLEHFIDNVIPRHVAQVVTGVWWNDWAMPYGQEWGQVMALFGLPARKAKPDAHVGENRYHRVEES